MVENQSDLIARFDHALPAADLEAAWPVAGRTSRFTLTNPNRSRVHHTLHDQSGLVSLLESPYPDSVGFGIAHDRYAVAGYDKFSQPVATVQRNAPD
ncbi:hypothetical protein [Natronospirillum operosum]|uniref:hypothetical protein n=1 Tax=Natronospirillum operosum TaxID=2759953 RepID=UPI00143682F2|nr:hypothetical protein [Natronospirillum operosum]